MVPDTGIETAAELERLRAENAALKQQVAAAEEVSSTRSAKLRNTSAVAIMLVATLALALAIPAVWVNRMVTSTDYYVETVAPLADDPAIQDAVAVAASDAAIEQLDLQTRLESRLPTDLAFLAAPINSAAEGFISKQATALVRSDAFAKLWEEANRVGHNAFVTAVTGKDTGALQVEAGTITLDLGVLVDKLMAELSGGGFGLLEKVSTGAADKTITLYQSDALAQASSLVDRLQQVALLLPLLGLVLAAGSVVLAADRRRTLLWLGWSLLVWTLLPLQAIFIGQSMVGEKALALAGIPTDAAENAYAIIFSALITSERLFAALAVIIIFAAVLAGPSKWATALRRGVSGGITGVSSHLNLGAFGEWVGARMPALRVAGYLFAAVLLVALPTPRTMTQIWWIVALVVVWLFAVQLLGSGTASSGAEPESDVVAPPEAGEAAEVALDSAEEAQGITEGDAEPPPMET